MLRKRPTRPTIGEAFDPQRNSLNLIRAVLAGAVIVSHGWPVAGYGTDPTFGGYGIGHWAVAGFFTVSGYLVTASRVNIGFWDYLSRRAARILPGFWACLAFTAFVVAPVTAWLTGHTFLFSSAVRYVVANAGLVIVAPGIDDTLGDVPYRDVWNGSLWTLKWEFLAYLAIGALMLIPVLRRRPAYFLAGFAALTVVHAILQFTRIGPDIVPSALWLSTSFAAGVVLYLYRDRIPSHGTMAAGALALLIVSCLTSTVNVFGALPIAYLLMWLSTALPLHRAFRKNDISYGLYIYAFVVQQCLTLAGIGRFGVAVFVLASVVGTVPLAYASWFLVEKPAKSAIGRIARRRAGVLSGRHRGRPADIPRQAVREPELVESRQD